MERDDPTRIEGRPDDVSAVSVGEKVGPYQIEGILGAGGMGKVYRALDPRLGRHVALKFLSGPYAAGSIALDRFQREARAISALNHPHVCTIYDIGEDRHGPFLVMELLEGQTLKQRIPKVDVPMMKSFPPLSRYPMRWKRLIPTVSCIATSNPRTSSSRSKVSLRFSISASRNQFRAQRDMPVSAQISMR
jgi:serine/threonine protein kinase